VFPFFNQHARSTAKLILTEKHFIHHVKSSYRKSVYHISLQMLLTIKLLLAMAVAANLSKQKCLFSETENHLL